MIWRDGRIVDAPPRLLPPADIGGIFTTVGCDGGRILMWPRHRDRLLHSLRELKISGEEFIPTREELEELLRSEGLAETTARMRVVLGLEDGGRPRAEASVVAAPDVGPFQPPIRLLVQRWDDPPAAGHKLIARRRWDESRERARELGFDDVLLVDQDGRALETAVANVFVLENIAAATPPSPQRCLPGVMRGWLLGHLRRAAFSPTVREIHLDEVLGAEEVWVTNSVGGVRRVGEIGEREWAAWPEYEKLSALGVPAPGWLLDK